MSKNKGIGIPRGLFYYNYRPFISAFSDSIDVDVKLSPKSSGKTLENDGRYTNKCMAEKLFRGHCDNLEKNGYLVFVPQNMKTEFGKELCIKGTFDGCENKFFFKEELWEVAQRAGASKGKFEKAYKDGIHAQKHTVRGYNDKGYPHKALLAGQIYNIHDKYINFDIIKKLNQRKIGVITQERINEKNMKEIEGVIYISLRHCHADIYRAANLKRKFEGVPFMKIEIGEHLHRTGLETKLEIFNNMISRRRTDDEYRN